ncbi:MAG: phage integrase family protein [Myxococcales bacterium]|nr:phage integrase family protein [Myxococcales bacterium]
MMTLLMGMRASEIVQRIARDIDDQVRILWVTASKTEAGKRRFGVPVGLRPYLGELAKGKSPGDLLFGLRDRGWPNKCVQRICHEADVPVVCPRNAWPALNLGNGPPANHMPSISDVAVLVTGVVTGYVHASFVESWSHDQICHARRSTLDRYGQLPFFGRRLRNSWRSHTAVHHGMTFRPDYTMQFASSDEEARACTYVLQHRLDPGNDFGLSVSLTGFFRFLLPFMVLNTVVVIVAPLLLSIPFVVLSLVSPLFSKFVHPHLHKPYKRACSTAPLLIRLLLRSPMGPTMWTRHFLHHRHPRFSFNLMMPIGDWLRGVTWDADALDLVELRRVGGPGE